jgi:hypothetical protein
VWAPRERVHRLFCSTVFVLLFVLFRSTSIVTVRCYGQNKFLPMYINLHLKKYLYINLYFQNIYNRQIVIKTCVPLNYSTNRSSMPLLLFLYA